MDLEESVWSLLQVDLVDRVLSFLSVPDLCRFRAVCKRWNELVCRPSFHDLCDENDKNRGKRNTFLAVRRHWSLGLLGDLRRTSTSFLDLDAKRWYSIKVDEESPRPTQLLAMDDGLMCQSSANFEEFVISYPLAVRAKRRVLPKVPFPCSLSDVRFSLVVMAVDSGARSFKVVVIDDDIRAPVATRMFVYASSSNEWRGLRNPPEGLASKIVWSGTIFRENLYFVVTNNRQEGVQFVVWSYNLEDDTWGEPIKESFPRKLARPPQFVRSCDRLFMMMGIFERCGSPNSDREPDLLEVKEVLIADNDFRTVAQITFPDLKQMFGEQSPDFHVAYGVPCVDSEGLCKSITLVSYLSGKVLSYDLVSGSVDVFPALSSLGDVDHDDIQFCNGEPMRLSLRILTSQELG